MRKGEVKYGWYVTVFKLSLSCNVDNFEFQLDEVCAKLPNFFVFAESGRGRSA